jgi:hypothetical protein
MPTVKMILANRLMPGILDRILAAAGYSGQLTAEQKPVGAPANLIHSVPGPFGAHGRFDARACTTSWEFLASRRRNAIVAALTAIVMAAVFPAIRHRGAARSAGRRAFPR